MNKWAEFIDSLKLDSLDDADTVCKRLTTMLSETGGLPPNNEEHKHAITKIAENVIALIRSENQGMLPATDVFRYSFSLGRAYERIYGCKYNNTQ